eukprot:1445594-Amphidinium_carterae.1
MPCLKSRSSTTTMPIKKVYRLMMRQLGFEEICGMSTLKDTMPVLALFRLIVAILPMPHESAQESQTPRSKLPWSSVGRCVASCQTVGFLHLFKLHLGVVLSGYNSGQSQAQSSLCHERAPVPLSPAFDSQTASRA